MKIIKLSLVSEFLEQNPSAKESISLWHKLVCCGTWNSFEQLRQTFPKVEKSRQFTFFSVGCGSIFIVAYVDYKREKLFVRQIYDKQHLERSTQSLSRAGV